MKLAFFQRLGAVFAVVELASAATLNVCLVQSSQWVVCDPSQPASTYTGFDVLFFRDAAQRAGWFEVGNSGATAAAVTYQFVCTNELWSAVSDSLLDANPALNCTVAAGLFVPTSQRMQLGIQMSLPYYRTGLVALLKNGDSSVDSWAFMKPFTPLLWVIFLITVVIVPVFVWIWEALHVRGYITLSLGTLEEMRQATYTSMLAVFNLNVFKVKSVAAQITILCFCFLVLITMATYVANLAAALTVVNFDQQYKTLKHLRGRRVATSSLYHDNLKKLYGIDSSVVDWSGGDTFSAVKRNLTEDELDAYILDYPGLGYYVMSNNSDCSVRLLAGTYSDIMVSYLFHRNFTTVGLHEFNTGLVGSLEANKVEELGEVWLTFQNAHSRCTSDKKHASVSLKQLAGLWVILVSVLGFSALLTCIEVIRRLMSNDVPPHERRLSSIFVKPGTSIHGMLSAQSFMELSTKSGTMHRRSVSEITGPTVHSEAAVKLSEPMDKV